MARITISLMQEFDRLSNDIIVIGGTNRIDRIDEALLRRFTVKHEVKRLDKLEREEMISDFYSDIGIEISLKDFEELAEPDDTQAALMNRMIMVLVNHFMEE